MRARMERCFARHPNRDNAHARSLLLGEFAELSGARRGKADPPRPCRRGDLPRGRGWRNFDGFALNILDGAGDAYGNIWRPPSGEPRRRMRSW